jgi:dTDP-4-dehydrorhamnose 3,5-epimerase-like enzyme
MRSSRYHQLLFVSRAFIGGIPRLDKADTVIYMARQFYVKWHPLGPVYIHRRDCGA